MIYYIFKFIDGDLCYSREYLPKVFICDNENKNRAEVLRLHFLQFGLANIKVKDYDEYSVFKTQYDSNGYYYVTNNVDADIKEFV